MIHYWKKWRLFVIDLFLKSLGFICVACARCKAVMFLRYRWIWSNQKWRCNYNHKPERARVKLNGLWEYMLKFFCRKYEILDQAHVWYIKQKPNKWKMVFFYFFQCTFQGTKLWWRLKVLLNCLYYSIWLNIVIVQWLK